LIPALPSARRTPGDSFAGWLLRPYLDLAPAETGPIHTLALEECWRAFADPGRPRFVRQSSLPPAFRAQLLAEAGDARYGVEDPRALPAELRSERWSALCEAMDRYAGLPAETRCRLLHLLHSLCFFSVAMEVAGADAETVDIEYWLASCRYAAGSRGPLAGYRGADLSAFEVLAERAPKGSTARFNSAMKVLVHKAKTGAPLKELERWAGRAETALSSALLALDTFGAGLMTSRFYRGAGFVPHRREDRKELERIMALAERHAAGLEANDGAQRLLRSENLHAVLESRTKEALWRGELDKALERAARITEIDPYDAKAHAEVGQVRVARKEWREAAEAYLRAATLGAPAAAIGRYMAGVCYRELGMDALAGFLFKEALEIDPLGISSRDQLHDMAPDALLDALNRWSLSTLRM
jgi:tetratricopeptide (TPR) repeat protein